MLFNLLLANITVSLCFFFLLLVAFSNFFTSPVHNENVRLRLALAIPTGAPIILANDAIETLPKIYQNNQKKKYACGLKMFAIMFWLLINLLVSFEMCSTPKLSKYATVLLFTNKPIQ